MNGSESSNFRVEHTSSFSYEREIKSSIMSVRLQPLENEKQQLLDFNLETDPVSDPLRFDDAFGNICHILNIVDSHRELTVRSSSELLLKDSSEFANEPELDSWELLSKEIDPVEHWDFLNESEFARNSTELESFMTSCGIEKGSGPVSSMIDAAYSLYHYFSYEPGSTDVHSPTETILQTRCGVCQDYTHVLLSIGRLWGIPSRYVSGYLRLNGANEFQSPVGESHCWVEFLQPQVGWIGVDPTNETLADDRYIQVAIGRDYADVPPTKGVLMGPGESSVAVQVLVTPAGTESTSSNVSSSMGADQ